MSIHSYSLKACYDALGWTESQIKAMMLVPKITGGLSALGSSYIIYDILKAERKRQSQYHRIMVAMSLLEFLVSFFGHFLSSWPMPKGYQMYAVGNDISCGIASFFYILGMLGTPLYNCSLVTHYTLVIKQKWSKDDIQVIEKWYHIIPSTICVTMAILPFALGVNGPAIGFLCW